MGYNSGLLKFDYAFITCKGSEGKTPDEEASDECSALGKRGYRIIRWYVKENGINHMVLEKQYRG